MVFEIKQKCPMKIIVNIPVVFTAKKVILNQG